MLVPIVLCVLAVAPAQPAATDELHGWRAIVLRNQAAEVVIVPEIGRVMRFTLRGAAGGRGGASGQADEAASGPFWTAPGIGKELPADAEGWRNYGGDKTWPAPQSDWAKVAGRGWPPPAGFDAAP